ncbi:MAG: hypothetical protein MUE35_00480 [Hydrogenophaga sp.]|nr:hypothetical protein [Hydrogenophaga sp.]
MTFDFRLDDLGDAPDDATDDMACDVRAWVWYGYYATEAMDRWIQEAADEGRGVDIGWIKALLARTLARKRAAEATWPAVTDTDRLDNAFEKLNAQGICALQWAGNTLDDGFEAVDEALEADHAPAGGYQGYCFFHSQDIDRALDGEGLLLAFGHIDSKRAQDHLRIGEIVRQALQQEGIEVAWDGKGDTRINLPRLRWHRRTPD